MLLGNLFKKAFVQRAEISRERRGVKTITRIFRYFEDMSPQEIKAISRLSRNLNPSGKFE